MTVFDDDAGLKKCPTEEDCVEIKNNPASSSVDSPHPAGNSSDLDKNVPVFADAGIQCKRSNEIGLEKYPIKNGCVEIKNATASPTSLNLHSLELSWAASPSIGNSSDLDQNVLVKTTDLDVRLSHSNEDRVSNIKTGSLSAEVDTEVFECSAQNFKHAVFQI